MISLKGKTILVVDDEEMLREIMIDDLTDAGATVVGAENGGQAFELIKQQKFDAVISDVRMAGGDGLSLFKNIQDQIAVKPKLFLCSAFNDVTKDTAKFLGVVEIFPKPFDDDRMIQSLAKALGITGLKAA